MAQLNFSTTLIKDASLLCKYLDLCSRLQNMGHVYIGYSGGVDSTLLCAIAREILGKNHALAFLATGPSLPESEKQEALALSQLLDLNLEVFQATEFENPAYVANGPDRCYHCKTDLFVHLKHFASAHLDSILLYGGNLDDTQDFRPGAKAAKEFGARAPLAESLLSKMEIRILSKLFGLPTADRPAQPCLSSRIPYGSPVDPKKLAMVESGEALLKTLGFREYRLRHYGETARIEVSQDQLARFNDSNLLLTLQSELKKIGFEKVEIDPKGFRSGNLNRVLSQDEKRYHS